MGSVRAAPWVTSSLGLVELHVPRDLVMCPVGKWGFLPLTSFLLL